MFIAIICVLCFYIGLKLGLKLEYKNSNQESMFKELNDELDKNLYDYYENQNKTNDIIESNGLTPEIIDEWMNGGEEE